MYYNILLVTHIIATFTLIIVILMQRSASDGMGLSGSSSSSFLSGRAAAKGVTHTTAILGAIFILTSLAMGVLTARSHPSDSSIIDRIGGKPAVVSPLSPTNNPLQGSPANAPAQPAAPAEPAKPSVPRPE